MRFNADVAALKFDDALNQWEIHTKDGIACRADSVVVGTAPLNKPNAPNVPGLEQFTGTMFHSSQWRHNHNLAGERIAVIGTGASVIQLVPEIAAEAKQLYLFQGTPAWIVPRLAWRVF
ncbi:MAG: NAD(P)-binding domain-containing protein [Burkholderiales bacterium]